MLIREIAERVARYVSVERRLFEIVGSWSADCPDPEAAALFATLAGHHGWRAQQWEVLAPVLHDVAVDEPVIAYLDSVAWAGLPAERLTALAERVLPALLEEYRVDLAAANEVSDGPWLRLLRLVTVDLEYDRQAAESSLARAG